MALRVVHHRELFAGGDLRQVPKTGGLMAVYGEMVESAGPAIARLVDLVAPGPTLVHCTAGKDRTGVSVAALLLLAGVEQAAVVEAVGLLVDRVSAWPGGVRGWFLDNGASAEGIDRFVGALVLA